MKYTAGKNIAIKVPDHEFHETVKFYRETLGFKDAFDYNENALSTAVLFGENILWIDSVATLSQAEVWFEINTDDIAAARADLEMKGVATRDSLETLPEDLDGLWISGPGNIIHLLRKLTAVPLTFKTAAPEVSVLDDDL